MQIEKNHVKMLESCLRAGDLAEAERLTSNRNIRSRAYYQILVKAITTEQIEAAKLLIHRKCLLHDYFRFDKTLTILHLAVNTRDSTLVKLLLEHKDLTKTCYLSEIPPHFNIVDLNLLQSDSRCFQLMDCFVEARLLKFKEKRRGFTILHYAAERGNADIISDLVARNCKLDELSNDGTALHIAVVNKHPEVVKTLLKEGANPTVFNERKVTPLYLAVENQDIEISEILINSSVSKKRSRNCKGHPKEQFFQKKENKQLVYLATGSGNVPLLRMLLSHGATTNCESATGDTPLHLAVEKQDLQIVNLLLKHNARVTAVDKKGFTPFHLACQNGNPEIVSALLKCNKRSKIRLVPLHLAVQGGHSEVVNLLLKKGADCEAIDKNGKTPLSCALESLREDTTVLAILLKRIREINRDATFLMPLENLVEKYAKVNETGDSILHLAVEKEDEAAVDLILKHNACIDLRNKNGLTPLELATINASVPIIKLFLQRDDHSFFGGAMHLAIEKGNTEILELFLKAGVSANLRNEKGLMPLHVAVQKNDKKVFLLLLENGAKVDAPGRWDFETPMFIAAEKGSSLLEILLVCSLIKNDAKSSVTKNDTNSVTKDTSYSVTTNNFCPAEWKDGYLSMYIAAYRGHERIVKLLLDAGVNPNSNFRDYLTPLHAAAQQGHENIVRLLLTHGALANFNTNSGSFEKKFCKNSESSEKKFCKNSGSSEKKFCKNSGSSDDSESSSFKSSSKKILHATICEKNIYSSTPLLVAAYNDHTSIVQLLLSHGADCNAQLRDFFIKSSMPKKQSPMSCDYTNILTRGNYSPKIIQEGLNSFDAYTPLYFAVEGRNEKMVKLLITSGADVHEKTVNYDSIVDLAILREDESIIKLLLSAGADASINRNKESRNVLKRNVKVAEIIVNHMGSSKAKLNPLGVAVENDLEKCVEKLLDSGVDVNKQHKGKSVLFFALRTKALRILKMLLKHGINVNVRNEKGNTPLQVAVENWSLEVVELLLDAGSEFSTTLAEDFQELNPLDLAISMRNDVMVEMFLNRGYVGSGVDCSFCLALESGSAEIVNKFLNSGLSDDEPLFGKSPLYHAIVNDNVEVVEFLLKEGISFEDYEDDGYFLHVAISNLSFKEEMIKVLVDYGISINTKNTKGKTPVWILTEKLFEDNWPGRKISKTIELLILNGVDPNQLYEFDGSSQTVLEIAIIRKHLQLVEFLILNGANINVRNSHDHVPIIISVEELLHFAGQDSPEGKLSQDVLLKINSFLLGEVMRRKVIYGDICRQNQSYLPPDSMFYGSERLAEIRFMKERKICEGVSYFDILGANHRKLSNLARNEAVKLLLLPGSLVNKMFPIYCKFLIHRIRIGRDRRHLLDSCSILLQQALRFYFPTLIVEHIFSFLSDRDLRHFNSAFKKDMFSYEV